MKDKYILLRFIAFYLFFKGEVKNEEGEDFEYKNDIDELLARTMDTLNEFTEPKIKEVEETVINALGKSYFYLGKDAFRLYKADGKRSAINMNVFETVVYMMLYLPKENTDIKKDVMYVSEKLMKNSEYLDAIGNHRDNIHKIRKRFEIVKKTGKELGA